MTKIIPAVLCIFMASGSAAAGLESLASGSAASFQKILAQPQTHLQVKSYVPVSGQVSLSGSAYVPNGSSYVTVTLTGFAYFKDSSGRITSHPAYIHVMHGFWANQAWVSNYVYVTAYPSFFQDGASIGAFPVSGSVHVSGWITGNWIRLTGTGTLAGTVAGKN
ncbi:MAG: hypothetical protein HY921_02115 [Elusimicrobia bacterium]|nr:hypothetical protein [Elusimicrobiota bacterium]